MLGDEGVTVREEDLIDSAEVGSRPIDLLLKLLKRTNPEALVPVHGAEGAAVVAAADSRLEDQTVGLRRGAKELAFVLDHGAHPMRFRCAFVAE